MNIFNVFPAAAWAVQIIGMLLIALAIITLLPWRKWGESIFSNDASKAIIYIEFGDDSDAVYGKYLYTDDKGKVLYTYRWHKMTLKCGVPDDYGYAWLHGRRKLRIANPGDFWCSYWPKKNDNVPRKWQKSAFDINSLIEGQVIVSLVRSIYGKRAIGFGLIVLLLVGGAGGYYVYNHMNQKPAEANPPAKQAPVTNDNVPLGYELIFDNPIC